MRIIKARKVPQKVYCVELSKKIISGHGAEGRWDYIVTRKYVTATSRDKAIAQIDKKDFPNFEIGAVYPIDD